MKYEEPKIELVFFESGDVITLSGEESGPGVDTTGPWG